MSSSLAIAVLTAGLTTASAQVSAAGWVGGGVVGEDPAMTVDVGIDYGGEHLSFGLGGRLRYLADDGFRDADWDEASELAGLVRYARYERIGDTNELVVVAGRLGDVDLGHGAVFDGYESALNVDHMHLGVQMRADGERLRFDALVDDVIAPRLFGARTAVLVGKYASFGATGAADVSAPSLGDTSIVPFIVADAALDYESADEREMIRGYVDAVSIPRVGSGIHLGVNGRASFGGGADSSATSLVHVGARGELRVSSAGYIPGWIGPLYEATRSRGYRMMRSQLDIAQLEGEAELSALGALSVEVDDLGSVQVTYASRPGMPRLIHGRVVVPHLPSVQAAFWGAAELSKSGARAAALEVRVRLNRHAFLVVEGARLYRDGDMGVEPVWLATVAVGAALGR